MLMNTVSVNSVCTLPLFETYCSLCIHDANQLIINSCYVQYSFRKTAWINQWFPSEAIKVINLVIWLTQRNVGNWWLWSKLDQGGFQSCLLPCGNFNLYDVWYMMGHPFWGYRVDIALVCIVALTKAFIHYASKKSSKTLFTTNWPNVLASVSYMIWIWIYLSRVNFENM